MTTLIQPVQGRISSQFGVDRGSHAHAGVDFAAACGTPVYAAAAGQVSAANYSATAGNLVHIEHGGGVQTRYFHLQRSIVGVGANVAQGQLIGYVGNTGNSTGCHLHFEVRVNGAAVDPVYALQSGAGAQSLVNASAQSNMSMFVSNEEMMLVGLLLVLAVVLIVD